MKTGNFFNGLVLGAAAGIAVGLLMAPMSGAQTRRNVVRRSRKYSQQAVDAVKQYVDSLKHGKLKSTGSSTDAEELLKSYRGHQDERDLSK